MQDPNRHPEYGDGERVVVRDRRRVDPDTGAVRTPDGSDRSPTRAPRRIRTRPGPPPPRPLPQSPRQSPTPASPS